MGETSRTGNLASSIRTVHARYAHFTKAYFTMEHIIQNADFVTRVQTVSERTLHEPPLRNLIEEKYAFFNKFLSTITISVSKNRIKSKIISIRPLIFVRKM